MIAIQMIMMVMIRAILSKIIMCIMIKVLFVSR